MISQKGLAPILIVILIALAVGGYLIYTNYSNNRKLSSNTGTTPQPTPVSGQNKAQFVPGEIVIGIKSGVKFKEAEELIKSYKLTYKAPERFDLKNKKEIPYDPEEIVGERPVFFIVFVPKGGENKWVEIFSSSSIVKYSSLDNYSYAQNK